MSSAQKTEKPTPQRLKKEGRKGKSYNSRDLIAAAVLLGGLPAIALLATLKGVAALYVDIASHRAGLSPHRASWKSRSDAVAVERRAARPAAPLLLAQEGEEAG